MYRRFGKRALDIALAFAIMLVLAPVLVALAAGVRLSSPGPAIFRQHRVGTGGALFEMYKFRSMPVATRSLSSDQLGEVEIKPFGKFLRRTNLDELPQIFNILRGDMSFIGPRPPIPAQVELVQLRQGNGALDCRPGLTGLAQINSFDGMSVEKKAGYDGDYAATISLWRDVVIAVRTFGYLTRPPPTY